MKERLEKGKTKKHPAMAALLSALLPGAGQAYNRETVRAGILILIAILLIFFFTKLQLNYNKSYEIMMKSEGIPEVAEIFAEEQHLVWIIQNKHRWLILSLYLGLILFSAYDAYVFSAYILKTVMIKPVDDDDDEDIDIEKTGNKIDKT